MASQLEVVNLALLELGATRPLGSLSEDNKRARSIKAIFDLLRQAELRKHPWRFAKKRARLAPDTSAPVFGFTYKFRVPSDFIRFVREEDAAETRIEGPFILYDGGDVLDITYIADVPIEQAGALFAQALALQLALTASKDLSGESTTFREELHSRYRAAINEAKNAQAIENAADDRPEDPWVTTWGL